MLFPSLLFLIQRWSVVRAAVDIGYTDDTDLTSFITVGSPTRITLLYPLKCCKEHKTIDTAQRPEIKAPILNVEFFEAHKADWGFFFVGPYASIVQQSQAANYYQPCQKGLVIYDQDGELVWSGACMFRNQNAYDFRVFEANSTQYLFALLYAYGDDTKGHGTVLDSSYSSAYNVTAPVEVTNFNMHEYNVFEEDNQVKALHILQEPKFMDIRELEHQGLEAGWVADLGFREVDVASGVTLFEWWATDHRSLIESNVELKNVEGPPQCPGTGCMYRSSLPRRLHTTDGNDRHLNSVNKNEDGDYLLSSRFLDTVFKVSGRSGAILYRRGGKRSSFDLQGFNFSRQHDARWLSHSRDEEILTLLDNAAGTSDFATADISSAIVVRLDKRADPMKAYLMDRVWKPDGSLSKLRGNYQILPSGNRFVGWSDNCYMSEHTSDGETVMEARFRSQRFVSYRSYKFNFTGSPTESPDLKVLVHGNNPATSVMVYYVSWNGATNVETWKFYRGGDSLTDPPLIGQTRRTGFETTFYSHGYEPVVYAETVAVDGSTLGASGKHMVAKPGVWEDGADDAAGLEYEIEKVPFTEKTEF